MWYSGIKHTQVGTWESMGQSNLSHTRGLRVDIHVRTWEFHGTVPPTYPVWYSGIGWTGRIKTCRTYMYMGQSRPNPCDTVGQVVLTVGHTCTRGSIDHSYLSLPLPACRV